MTKTFEELYDDFEKRHEKEHNIFCPYCGNKQDEEVMSEHTSYHGEKNDDEKLQTCDECGKEFVVEEIVDRTFKTEKI